MTAEKAERLKGYILKALGSLPFRSGTKLEWEGKKLDVYQDDDGYFWMDAKCFTLSGAVEYAAEQLGVKAKPIVHVVVKEYDYGCRPIAAFHNEADAVACALKTKAECSRCIACHVTPMEVQ